MQNVDYVIMGAAALILLLVGMLFFPSGPNTYLINSGYDDGCKLLKIKYSCDQSKILSITAFTSGKQIYTLGNVCATKGFNDTLSCARSCGCNINGGTMELTPTPKIDYGGTSVEQGFVEDEPEEIIPEEPTGEEYYGI